MTKEELVYINYSQKIALANLTLSIGNCMSTGTAYRALKSLYANANVVQGLFYYESLKTDSNLDDLQGYALKLNHLLSKYLPTGPIEIVESDVVAIGEITVKHPDNLINTIRWDYFDEEPLLGAVALRFSKDQFLIIPSVAIDFTQAASGKFAVFSETSTARPKTVWENTINGMDNIFNRGVIPDQVWKAPVIYNDRRYFVSRKPITLDDQSSIITFK